MRNVLMGSRPFHAPNDDTGAEFDDADADDLETPEPAGDGDEDPDEDADDELDADEPEGDEDEPVAAAPAPKRTASDEIRELRRRAQEAERRAEEAERTAQARRSEEAEHRERERLAQMTPEERQLEVLNQRLARAEFSTWDTNDRVQFEGLASGNAAVASVKDEVEQLFQAQLRAGRPTDRATIAKFVIGEKALAKAPAAKRKAQKAADASRAKNKASPTSGRGDVPATRGRSTNEAEARRRRLEDLEI